MMVITLYRRKIRCMILGAHLIGSIIGWTGGVLAEKPSSVPSSPSTSSPQVDVTPQSGEQLPNVSTLLDELERIRKRPRPEVRRPIPSEAEIYQEIEELEKATKKAKEVLSSLTTAEELERICPGPQRELGRLSDEQQKCVEKLIRQARKVCEPKLQEAMDRIFPKAPHFFPVYELDILKTKISKEGSLIIPLAVPHGRMRSVIWPSKSLRSAVSFFEKFGKDQIEGISAWEVSGLNRDRNAPLALWYAFLAPNLKSLRKAELCTIRPLIENSFCQRCEIASVQMRPGASSPLPPHPGSTLANPFTSVIYHTCEEAATCKFTLPGLPNVFGNRLSVRVVGIDTPEIQGECEQERNLAIRARDHMRSWLRKAKQITLKKIKRGKSFRVVASILADGQDLGRRLVESGLAKAWDGHSPKPSWCDYKKGAG